MKTKLLLPVILLSTISLAYAGGRTPPANGNSNSSKPTQAEVTGEPSKGGSFQDDGSEGIGGDPGTPEESSAHAMVCASLLETVSELSSEMWDECNEYWDMDCAEGPDTDGDCFASFINCNVADAALDDFIDAMNDAGCQLPLMGAN